MFAIKVEIKDPHLEVFVFPAQKTMYGGKRIRQGDELFVFASENEGGCGLVARAIATTATAVPRKPGLARQTPRISLEARNLGRARSPLGRNELKVFKNWDDGRPETELNFKLYRQATNKVVGLSAETAAFLRGFFAEGSLAEPATEAPNG